LGDFRLRQGNIDDQTFTVLQSFLLAFYAAVAGYRRREKKNEKKSRKKRRRQPWIVRKSKKRNPVIQSLAAETLVPHHDPLRCPVARVSYAGSIAVN
jgi:hypothetical protein